MDDVDMLLLWLQQMEGTVSAVEQLEETLTNPRLTTAERQALEGQLQAQRELRDRAQRWFNDALQDGWNLGDRLTPAQRRRVFRVLRRLGLTTLLEMLQRAWGATASSGLGALGGALGKVVGKGIKLLGSAFGGAVLDILLDPKPLGGGWEERKVDSVIVKVNRVCFEICYLRGKAREEAIWSEVYSKSVQVDCPPTDEFV
jgi:hypothetical protein